MLFTLFKTSKVHLCGLNYFQIFYKTHFLSVIFEFFIKLNASFLLINTKLT